MSRAKYLAAKALGDALEAAEASLAGNVRILQQPPEVSETYPALAILPDRFETVWFQEDEACDANGDAIMLDDPANGDALLQVGELVGSMRIFAAARYPADRENLEDAIIRAFCQDLVPGRLLANVTISFNGFTDTLTTPLGYFLDSMEWAEEMAFSERRWSWSTVKVEIPILVPRAGAYLITSYQVALARDITTDISAETDPDTILGLLAPPPVEQYAVDENGTITEL